MPICKLWLFLQHLEYNFSWLLSLVPWMWLELILDHVGDNLLPFIIIIVIWRFVSAPITVKNISAWQCTCGKKGYAKLRENKIVLSSRLKTETDDSCLVCSGSWTRMWKRPFSEFRPKSRLDVTRRVGGAQTKWTWWSICRLQHVGEVRRAATPQALPRCTECNSPPISGQCTNFVLFDVAL